MRRSGESGWHCLASPVEVAVPELSGSGEQELDAGRVGYPVDVRADVEVSARQQAGIDQAVQVRPRRTACHLEVTSDIGVALARIEDVQEQSK